MYITLLQLAQMNGVDIRPYYPFAVQLFRMIQDTEKEGRGLCAGTSLYPDHRALINETGNDLSTFNNAVGYCAARSMTGLALRMGDEATARAADEFARRIEAGFPQLFDEAVGFYDSSIEADTGEKRRAPSNNAVKWENNYCGELTDAVAGRCLAFYERELVAPAGLRPYRCGPLCTIWIPINSIAGGRSCRSFIPGWPTAMTGPIFCASGASGSRDGRAG